MKNSFKLFFSFTLILALLIGFCGCTQAQNVNYNLSQSADNFECLRRIRVYNARTDMVILDMEGYMSISNNSSDELVVTCKTGDGTYKKNYVYLNEYVLYVVEDIDGTSTDPFHYKVHYYFALPDVSINQ